VTKAHEGDALWRLLLSRRIEMLPDLAPAQRELAHAFTEALRAHLDGHGVAPSPLVVARAADVQASLVDLVRIEDAHALEACGAGEATAKDAVARAEAAGKARERLRKAMKELEDSCAKAGTPIEKGLADRMRPLLKRAEGVLEESLRPPAKKRPSRKRDA
jgi:hypothetical protein